MEDQNKSGADLAPQMGVDPAKKKKMALWKKVLIGFAVFIIGVIAIAFMATRGASDAASQYVADIQAGNCSAIYATTTNTFRAETTEEQWNEACERIGSILTGEPTQNGIETNSNSGSDQTAGATFTIDGNDGKTYKVVISMVNRDDVWQLNGIDSTAQESSSDGEQ